jgi:hypothetical protein
MPRELRKPGTLHKSNNSERIIAELNDQVFYMPEHPCINGHLTSRRTRDDRCMGCQPFKKPQADHLQAEVDFLRARLAGLDPIFAAIHSRAPKRRARYILTLKGTNGSD